MASDESVYSPPFTGQEVVSIVRDASNVIRPGRGRPSKLSKEKQIAALKSSAQVSRLQNSKREKNETAFKETNTVLGSAKVLNPNVSIKLFQIYFKAEHKKRLDPEMIPFDNSKRKNHLLEFDVFRRLAASADTQGCDYWGALSWKFSDSMNFNGATLKSFINKNPGYDVYFCNPHPKIEGVYENLWVQGEVSHPNFISVSKAFLEAAGLKPKVTEVVIPSGYMASANYFVANSKFWDLYLQFVNDALETAEKNLSSDQLAVLLSPVADAKGLHNGANYVPFIVERLLTEFLLLNSKKIRAIKVQSPRLESKLSEHHKSLRLLKDLAIRGRSDWVLDSWRSYRNLFLSATADSKALAPYVKLLTNKNVSFPDPAN